MSIARKFLRLAKRYENRMKNFHDDMMDNRDFHITQMREVMKSIQLSLDVLYKELENWADAIQSVYEVDMFNNIFERIELVFLKKYVNEKYSRTLKKITITEDAKKRLKNVLNKLEVMNAFRRI